jgi:LysM repeat protein
VPDAHCHYCTRPAQEECHACGRLYCAEHGEDVCLRCLSPEAATPSPVVYRGALLALAVAAGVAIYLGVSPPESRSSQDSARPVATPTQELAPTATPTPEGATSSATATSSAPGTVVTATTPTPGGTVVHVVEAGDSLSAIADEYGVPLEDLLAANPGLSEDTPLQIGQQIVIPGP